MKRCRQQGAALILLLAVLALGGAWYLLGALNRATLDHAAARRAHNAAVLNQAKQALIGHVAMQAAKEAEPDPGRLPCPEAPGNAGGGLEGATQGTCILSAPNDFPAVGRFPWRTVGTPKLHDASGEPLWYAVAAGWALGTASTLVINSNCTNDAGLTCNSRQLAVDGVKDAVAVIIAPGPAMNVAASAGCTARNQVRAAPSPAMDARDYIECYSTALLAPSFVTSGPSTSFNDQVVKITAAELLPAIEAAIADRFAHQVAPRMRAAYSGGVWATTTVLPYAVPFATGPAASPGNRLQGVANNYAGLIPGSYAFAGPCTCGPPTPCVCPTPAACTVAAGDPRCDPAFVSWRAAATITRTGGINLHATSGCAVSGTPSTLNCTLNTYMSLAQLLFGPTWMTFNLDVTADGPGMTWRKLNAPPVAPAIAGIDPTYTNSPIGYAINSIPNTVHPDGSATLDPSGADAKLNADGSATIRINARIEAAGGSVLAALGGVTCSSLGLPLCYAVTVSVPMALLGDHDMLDPTNASYAWFFRNKWHEVSYYAIAPGIAPNGARACTNQPAGTCLEARYRSDDGKLRGLFILGGQKLGSQARPAVGVADLLEGANLDGASPFEIRSPMPAPGLLVNRAFNDRFAVIDANP